MRLSNPCNLFFLPLKLKFDFFTFKILVFLVLELKPNPKLHPISEPSFKPTLIQTYENLPIINKTKDPSNMKKKIQDGRTHILVNEKSFKESGPLGWWGQIKYSNPPRHEKISYNEWGWTLEKTSSLNEFSLMKTTCLKIKDACICCNATNIIYL